MLMAVQNGCPSMLQVVNCFPQQLHLNSHLVIEKDAGFLLPLFHLHLRICIFCHLIVLEDSTVNILPERLPSLH